MTQEYSSKNTSINLCKFPRIYTSKLFLKTLESKLKNNKVLLTDIGAGKPSIIDEMFVLNKTDNEKYQKLYQNIDLKKVTYLPYDKYNRVGDSNDFSLSLGIGNSDIVVISNVLNVIKEYNIRKDILILAKDMMRKNGKVFISVYEGNKSGFGKFSTRGWQENRKTKDYLMEVKEVFSDANIKNNIIII